MSLKSKIEWTDTTWNPVAGCMKVSPGCDNCYAIRVARALETRFKSEKYSGLTKEMKNGQINWTGEVKLFENLLDQPMRWKRPRKIFVNSMSDLFHEKVPFEFIDKVFSVMADCPQHIFQILTKRPHIALDYFSDPGWGTRSYWEDPLTNVWFGVSVEDQKTATERIPLLQEIPAKVRWISAEPLLGEIELIESIYQNQSKLYHSIDWVVVGGESGPDARPMHPEWVINLRDQCKLIGTSFFFKQWGEWMYQPELSAYTPVYRRFGKTKAGRLLDGKEYNEYPNIK